MPKKKMPPKGMPPKGMHKMPGGIMMSDKEMQGMMGKKAATKPKSRAKSKGRR